MTRASPLRDGFDGFAVLAVIAVGGCGDNRAPVAIDAPVTSCPASWAPSPPLAGVPPPAILGGDAYARWAEWPRLRFGVRAIMRGTYDRSGGNRTADASHYLYQRVDGPMVPLALEGPGTLVFARHNHWHGSPWRYVVDGRETVVSETTTADPTRPVEGSRWEPADAFPSPLAVTWSLTRGADLSWVPIDFAQSLELGYDRSFYGTGYFIAQRYPEGTAIASWSGGAPLAAAAALLERAGTELAPREACAEEGTVDVPEGAAVTVATLSGPATIRALTFTVAAAQAAALAGARLRITWDDGALPSIDAPLGLFFGTGSTFDRDGDGTLVRSLPMTVTVGDGASGSVPFAAGDVARFATYLPMPFTSARIELVGEAGAVPGVRWQLRAVANRDPPDWNGVLHATYRDHGTPTPGADLVLLDTTVDEGGGVWCGSFVGTSFTFSDRAVLTTLEGDPRFFFDGARSPQAYGTGTEEWGGGGDYWGGRTMTLPLAGHPVGAPSAAEALGPDDLIQSAYRFLLADAMPFGAAARIQLEHGPVNDSTERYRSVTYWYGAPGACLVETDRLDVGDVAAEAAHGYASPTASAVVVATSTWDAAGPTASVTADGRMMTGTTELTVALRPDNHGALLRRHLDYAWPDQRAEVWIADATPGAPFAFAGIWSTAGGTEHLHSYPAGELSPHAPTLLVSPHRWREDEHLLPAVLTRGRTAIRIRIVHAPVVRPVLPGRDPGPRAWSELEYRVFSYVMPSTR